jgi:predicted phage tail protein
MRDVILYGRLGELFGRNHRFKVRTPAEAISALKANFPGFESFMARAHLSAMGFKVISGKRAIEKYEGLSEPTNESDTFRLVPVLVGAGGWAKVLIGAVLIAGGVVVSGLSFGAASPIGGAMISIGVGLLIGGVSQLLTTPPSSQSAQAQANGTSYLFNGPTNTTVQGAAVPVGFGRVIVGSVVISAGIESVEDSGSLGAPVVTQY